ncbi:MAG: CRISPR-associated endonuclease Cas2 [Chloroflexi bacterium]|nr:CRISPR-associated endonuclease Cas2 [Chloroflexota bacterium]
MFVIVVYDANESRVAKYLKTLRRYLTWVQNSVFEGEIEEPGLRKLKAELARYLNKDEDSVVIYKFRSRAYYERDELGLPREQSDRQIF